MNAVETVGLTKRYGAVAAVDGLDLAIGRGELFSLLGVNGVTAAEADVENKRAVVQYTGEVSDEALVSAVKEAGYEAKMA